MHFDLNNNNNNTHIPLTRLKMSAAMSALPRSRTSPGDADFAYKPLSADADTRLVELEPAPDASFPLQCRITELCLSSEDLIEYEALSYTWGASEFTETLYVIEEEDKTSVIKITTNLRDALHRVRLRHQKRLLWVDAVCINQQDISDKSKQIPVMAQIFSAASRVLVWLGTSLEGQRSLVDIKKALRFSSRDSQRIEAHLSNLESSFSNLVKLPWFSRRWIIQEVVLAADAVMMCGAEEIDLIHLFRVMHGLVRKSKLPPALVPLDTISKLWKTWVFDSKPEGGLRLLELLSLFHESSCQVDLDIIYALCNLASDCVVVEKQGQAHENKISVVVDYSQTAECLYRSIVEPLLGLKVNAEGVVEKVLTDQAFGVDHDQRYLEVLRAVVERCDGSNRNFMAWLPDWRLPKRREPIFQLLKEANTPRDTFEMHREFVRPRKKNTFGRLKIVNSVLEPFPEHPDMAEVKNWLQTMRDRFADYQPHLSEDQFLEVQSAQSMDFLVESSLFNRKTRQMSPDCVWCAFLFIVLEQGTWWSSPMSNRTVDLKKLKDGAWSLCLLSFGGQYEVQVSSECLSFLCSLFRGRRIFSSRRDDGAHDTISGLGIGPDHLEAGAFYNLDFAQHTELEYSSQEDLVRQQLLWQSLAEREGLVLVGDAGVYQLADRKDWHRYYPYQDLYEQSGNL
ncbi:hypothetical protein PFICI_13347 [Pestalotiopsis fici W106-1]|uniref:Heterokaryon incompatibility domain-containing protein n=1 Tax=Pestalotiopsis fici (strain W106-1 / CGMCC3.15140) TaxID=1229662 RepID=W3WLX0_PESFW|nr:uncharacterized protein PFICI_13347 [Pestalotiopsis fici W106-1]ETS74863.1 hypothetical protein PFICI_13347 [Pestalotiopsis fici W106-1]